VLCQVWYNPISTGPRAFIDAVTAAGFEASLLDEAGGNRAAAEHAAELHAWRQLFWMAMMFTVPVFMLSMILPMWPGEKTGQGILLLARQQGWRS
jgi:hypothetical protein